MLFLGTPCVFPNLFPLVISLFVGLVSCTFVIRTTAHTQNGLVLLQVQGLRSYPQLGFSWIPAKSARVESTPGWSGRIWARTGCKFDAFGVGMCETEDCGGRLQCDGFGAAPPTSLFEITLGQGDGKDFYDVSMVDAYNLLMLAAPRGVHGECNATGCASDLNQGCPKELQVVGGDGVKGGVVA
uniref:Thaumatin-like protein n=1 Tax=Kalanchoe fedtschenkoi TaxID=63787 RepID=A0A7N0UR14_KALFE